NAITYLTEIINDKTISFFDQEIKIRAYNALAYISYKKLKVQDAAEVTDQAIEYLSGVNAEFKKERANTFFNAAIFHCYLKNFEYARECIYQAFRYSEPESKNLYTLLSCI